MSKPAFTQWSLLDPALMAKQFEVSHTATFNKFSLLSPALMEAQIEAKVGNPNIFTNSKGMYDTKWTPDSLATACT